MQAFSPKDTGTDINLFNTSEIGIGKYPVFDYKDKSGE
jgi:hypothetical protein